MLNKALLLFNTVKFLKFSQITNRIKRLVTKPRVELFKTPELSVFNNSLKPVIKCQQKMFDDSLFRFLNKEFKINSSEDWNSNNQDKLWLYNLHYFDDLTTTNSKERIAQHSEIIERWINENPPGKGNGWEPYPSSLRIVNWIKWSLLNNELKQDWLDSLAIQVRFLSKNLEYHLLGNHLIANAKALIFSGLYFQGPEADKWYKSGIEILIQELPEQVLADGGNFELSPMYHAIFLQDLLDIVNIHQVYNKLQPANIVKKAKRMLKWLENMCHPDGEIAFFNDSSLGIAPTFKSLLNYAESLSIFYEQTKCTSLLNLKESGYIRSCIGDAVLIADIAKIGPDYIPGHGHADSLSFELSLFGRRVIVNSGVSTYEPGFDRMEQRGTQAHSTISIDDSNSSEVWSGFRVGKRAKVFNINVINDAKGAKFSACHDGYKKYNEKVIHCRKWRVSENLLEIIDTVTGSGKHKIVSVFPLHPEVFLNNVGENSAELDISGKKVKVIFDGSGMLLVKESRYHQEFGLSIENKQLIYRYNGNLPFKTNLKISW
jgi:uncharacterized heparinase superfamily protein